MARRKATGQPSEWDELNETAAMLKEQLLNWEIRRDNPVRGRRRKYIYIYIYEEGSTA